MIGIVCVILSLKNLCRQILPAVLEAVRMVCSTKRSSSALNNRDTLVSFIVTQRLPGKQTMLQSMTAESFTSAYKYFAAQSTERPRSPTLGRPTSP